MSTKLLPAAEWPTSYLVRYQSGRGMALQVSVLLMLRALAGSPARLIRSAGVTVAAFAAGLGLSALDRFQEGWQVYLLFFVVPLLVGVVGGIAINANRTTKWFRAGSESEFRIIGGRLLIMLNGHAFGGAIDQVRKVQTLWGSSMLIFDDDKIVVVPTKVLPKSR